MKRIILIISIMACICPSVHAVMLEPGYFSDPYSNVSVLSLQNDYSSGDFSYGLTLNANLSDKDISMESAVIKYLEYDNGTCGIRYAPLEGMTFGYGLLLNDLNTLYYQPSFLTNEQSGLRLYYDFDNFVVETMGTYSHLYGINIKELNIFNLNVGMEFISDSDSLSSEAFGRSAYGAYVELPLTDEFSLFAESAASSNGGEASQAGVSFDYDLIFAFASVKAAAVSFNDKFVPGYFTTGYDLDPVDFASLEAAGNTRYGSIASIDLGLLGFISLGLENEHYTDGGSANSATLLIIPAERWSITGYVKELSFLEFRQINGKDANMVGGMIEYKTKGGVRASVNYEKTPPITDKKQYDSSFVKVGFEF